MNSEYLRLVRWIKGLKDKESSGGGRIPGEITIWAAEAAPSGWLLCDGTAVSRTTYAGLFAVIGTVYGIGDGSMTFNLPNLQGRVPIGRHSIDSDFPWVGYMGGEKTHILSVSEMPSHYHKQVGRRAPEGTSSYVMHQMIYHSSVTTKNTTPPDGSEYTGGSQAHNNLQPYIVLSYIIKC